MEDKKLKMMEDLESYNFNTEFEDVVKSKWLESMNENSLLDIKTEVEDTATHGANTGTATFCIYTNDNENLIKENLSEMFDFLEEVKSEYEELTIELNADNIVHLAVERIANQLSTITEEFDREDD